MQNLQPPVFKSQRASSPFGDKVPDPPITLEAKEAFTRHPNMQRLYSYDNYVPPDSVVTAVRMSPLLDHSSDLAVCALWLFALTRLIKVQEL